MPVPTTLSDFFEQMPAHVDVYHLGRRIAPCRWEHFKAFEHEQVAWEAPFRQQARMAFVIQADTPAESRIWCIALPLDELGQLQYAQRDMILQRLLEVGQHPEQEIDPLKDNPLAFAPDTMTRALLHAHICRSMNAPLSEAARLAQQYLLTPNMPQAPHWKMLSVQGVTDTIVAMDAANGDALAKQLPAMPDEVASLLCRCLEHAPSESSALVEALRERSYTQKPPLNLACLRAGLSSSLSCAAQWADDCLAHPLSAEHLAIISARGWHHLEDAERLPRYLNQLATCDAINFREALRDLATLPRLRLPVIMALRQASPTSALGKRLAAVGLPQ